MKSAKYDIDSPPFWVTKTQYEQTPRGAETYGVKWLLFENQINVTDDACEEFKRYVIKFENKHGVDSYANTKIQFNPNYETLVLHNFDIIRNGEIISALNPDGIRVYKNEKDTYRRIYNSDQTIDIILDDVSIGDILEYSYTVKGVNPEIPRRFATSFATNWPMSVDKVFYKIIHQASRNLFIKNHKTDIQPEIIRDNNQTIYQWNLRDTAQIIPENNTPTWYSPYPYIQLSEVQNWQEAANLIYPLYAVAYENNEEVNKIACEISAASNSPEKQIIDALRYVKNKIRYVSVPFANCGFIPHPPQITLDRGYGDCKDKTVLLVAILNKLGIKAYPTLINTRFMKAHDNYLPSLYSFDHAIVFVPFGIKAYWLDCTLNYYEGDLNHLYNHYEGYGLVISEDTKSLKLITRTDCAKPLTEFHEYFDISAGYGKPAKLQVKTIMRGYIAAGRRHLIEANNQEQMSKKLEEYYAKIYRSVKSISPTEFLDDKDNDELVTIENYKIGEAWVKKNEFVTFDYNYTGVREYLVSPGKLERLTPFSCYPGWVTQNTEITLPKLRGMPWKIEKKNENFSTSNFDLTVKRNYQNGKLISNVTLKYKSDHVPASSITTFSDDIDKAAKLLNNQNLYYKTNWHKGYLSVKRKLLIKRFLFYVILFFVLSRIITINHIPN